MITAVHARLDIRRTIALVIAGMMLLGMAAAPAAASDPMPSTNDANRANGWAHFNVDEVRVGAADITLVSTRSFISCFEYRVNGEVSPYPPGTANPNPAITDGRWRFQCIANTTSSLTFAATEYVEIRSVFGPESDERFDWTRVYVPTVVTMLDELVAAGGITPSLEAKIRHAFAMAEEWLTLPNKLGPALSHYDRAVNLLEWQADVVDKGKENQGDAAGLRALAAAVRSLADSYRVVVPTL